MTASGRSAVNAAQLNLVIGAPMFSYGRTRSATVLALSVVAVTASAEAQSAEPDTGRPIMLMNARNYELRSSINGRNYLISVALPPGYRRPGADTIKYPVLYVLDGERQLPLVTSMFRAINSQRAGDVILVGIGYPRGGPLGPPVLPDGTPLRHIDYTPPPLVKSDSSLAAMQKDWPHTGGAEDFLRIVKEEVIPFVEGRYRTNGDRGLH